MRFDKTIPVLDYYGKPIHGLRGPDDSTGFTFGELMVVVCGLGMQGDRPDDKLKSYALGLRFMEPGNFIELSDLDSVRLKALVGASFNPLIYGRVVEFLDHPLPVAA